MSVVMGLTLLTGHWHQHGDACSERGVAGHALLHGVPVKVSDHSAADSKHLLPRWYDMIGHQGLDLLL